jgi:hypothetical protein
MPPPVASEKGSQCPIPLLNDDTGFSLEIQPINILKKHRTIVILSCIQSKNKSNSTSDTMEFRENTHQQALTTMKQKATSLQAIAISSTLWMILLMIIPSPCKSTRTGRRNSNPASIHFRPLWGL